MLLSLFLTMGAAAYEWNLPRGFPQPQVPEDNPMSEAKVALGKRLFFDPILSISGKHSCASCHDPARAFTDGRARAIGALGETLERNSMSLVNAAYNVSYGWHSPEVQSLETQMLEPLLNEHPVELGLGGRQGEVIQALGADASYGEAFARAFPQSPAPIGLEHLVKAIAAYQRTLIFGDSPFDRYVFAGEHAALSGEARRGMALFFSQRAGCSGCHSGFNLSGPWRDAQGEVGGTAFARNGVGARATRIPTVRNVALTAPYMHDGRFETLDEVLEHYATVQPDSGADLAAMSLSSDERRALIAFLRSLTAAGLQQ